MSEIENAPEVHASSEALRYAVKNLPLNKEVLKQMVWDAADQLERMGGTIGQLTQIATQLNEKNGENETTIHSLTDTIADLQRQNQALLERNQWLETPVDPVPIVTEPNVQPVPEGGIHVGPELHPEDARFVEQPNARALVCSCWDENNIGECEVHGHGNDLTDPVDDGNGIHYQPKHMMEEPKYAKPAQGGFIEGNEDGYDGP